MYTFYDEVVIQEGSQGERWELTGIILHEVETSDVICVQWRTAQRHANIFHLVALRFAELLDETI